jgi:hypothetical protein
MASADLVQRFGLDSPTFVTAAQVLREALAVVGGTNSGAPALERQQYALHLARVSGSAAAGSDELFVRHTYLCQFAKVLAAAACFGVEKASVNIERVLDGRGFETLGISNIGEQDCFAWVLAPAVREQTLAVFRQIAASLAMYDLSRIEEDLLKPLYQHLVEPETRHELGEFYTPDWLAELTLCESGFGPGRSLLDPACGSGAFLFTATRLLARQGVTGDALVDFALDNLMGMEVHPLAVTIARITYLLALLPHLRAGVSCRQRAIPIALANALHAPGATDRAALLPNSSRPSSVQPRRFDVVAGNPPWIAYRYLRDASYQRDVKALARTYGLLARGETTLQPQLELSTLFFEHCRAVSLKPGGTLAFVMPRSVITGARQHRLFQEKVALSRILDLKEVAPLFGVETCVLILQGSNARKQAIPTTRYAGRLLERECTWDEASALLTRSEGATSFAGQHAAASPYYHSRIINGANLYPRNLCFVTSAQPDLAPGALARSSIMRSDPEVNEEARPPWKGLTLEGYIDDHFLYATLLSKHLVPFGVRRLHLVALPVRVGMSPEQAMLPDTQPDSFVPISLDEMRAPLSGLERSADTWFAPAERLWQQHKKATTRERLADWFNYQSKITAQSAAPGHLVIYNAGGSNLSAAVIQTHALPPINGAKPKAFVVEHKMYWFRAATAGEAFFLSALLNAPCVDAAMKPYQTRGIYVGPRDIERRPFEVCPIPQYDPGDADHQRLAELSQRAHAAVAALDLSAGGVVAARKRARQAAWAQLAEIDMLARRLLSLAPAALPASEDDREDEAVENAAEGD